MLSMALFAPASPSSISGTLSSIGAEASGSVLAVQPASGGPILLSVLPEAVVREREVSGEWRAVSLAALKLGEPLRITLDAAGRARAVDAEYLTVTTRAVVVQHGYLVGTDGVARKLTDALATLSSVPLGAYVQLRTDPETGIAFDALVSKHPFASMGKSARTVTVTFDVRVPVNTPPSATVYVATNAQNWTPNAVRLSPQPGNKWSATLDLAAGTVLQYKYTRGSWANGERDASGAEIPNRTLTVSADAKTQNVDDVVIRWADLSS